MKKVLSILLLAGITTLVACGPSAEEKAQAEKHVKDSLDAVAMKAQQDSIAAVAAAEKAKQDSISNAAAEKAKQDSLAAAAKKPAPKAATPVQKKKEEAKKATRGRG
jgi:hypothetical protein